MLRVMIGMLLGIALCAAWLHLRFFPEHGEIERQAMIAKRACDVQMVALLTGIKGVIDYEK
jgi:hypothetical protein